MTSTRAPFQSLACIGTRAGVRAPATGAALRMATMQVIVAPPPSPGPGRP